MAHLLNVDVIPSNDTKTLLITDTSLWDCDTPINNLILEVRPPGRGYFSKVAVQRDFTFRWTCVHLEMCCTDCDNCTDHYTSIPDGVYSIRLSYNPNMKTLSEFRHLRQTEQKKKYISSICELRGNKCGMTRRDYLAKEDALFKIRNYMDVAKYLVEECEKQDEGMELYEEVNDMLDKFMKSCAC